MVLRRTAGGVHRIQGINRAPCLRNYGGVRNRFLALPAVRSADQAGPGGLRQHFLDA